MDSPQVPPSVMPTNVGPPENVSPAPPVPLAPEPPKNNKLKTYLLMLGVVLLIITAILGSYYFLYLKKDRTPGLPMGRETVTLPKYFINCDDVRQVIEEENLLYAACLGGVLIVDKGSGEVRDQVGIPDGLSNSTATSLVKKGDRLFIGTQDGVTIFNLKTREAKKIRVAEGLVNGSNILLFEDGDNIWVATFDGVALLDTKTLSLKNYTSELDAAAEKRNITNMLVSENYVYFLEIASVHSRGGVVMYNKQTQEFKIFGPDAFGVTGQYARIDFQTTGRFGDKVFVAEGNKLFMSAIGGDSWQKIESTNAFIMNDLNTDFASVNLLANSDPSGVLISSGNKVYRYNPNTDTTEVLYDFGEFAGILPRNSGDSIWMRKRGEEIWLSKLFLSSLKLEDFKLKERPVSFERLLAVIDNKPIVHSRSGVYQYDLETNKFNKLGGIGLPSADYGIPEAGFLPIPESAEIFSVWQSCGQGCEKPLAQSYNYQTGETQEIEIPEEVLDVISTDVLGTRSYESIQLTWYDFSNSEVGFYNSFGAGNPPESVIYNYALKTWRVANKVPNTATILNKQNGVYCNKAYVFESNGNKFSKDDCTGLAENEQYVWVVEEGRVKETTKANGQTKFLNPPSVPPKYTPFDTVANLSFGPITFADHMLWILTSRGGLVSYNPTDSSFKLYGPSEGVLSQENASAFIGTDIWVWANWGGLSGINQ